jgi:hypothetical protein|tara:strand:+ start:5517 stop:6131 length:615 start_codon:yes stop_codon:yes gene_type:complete
MSFKKNKYKVVKNAIDKKFCKFLFDYFLNRRYLTFILLNHKYINPSETMLGAFGDGQVPQTFSIYSDIVFETLLQDIKPMMEKETQMKLYPNYSYARLYKKGDVLKRHKDRMACDISTTLNLGGQPWPIYLEPTGKEGKKGVKIDLNPGDMLIYRGCDLEHWREPFKGTDCAQVFLHYNKKSKNAVKFDGRPMLGLPVYFKKRK